MIGKSFHLQTQRSAANIKSLMRKYIPQKLHIYDGGGRNSISGIRATIFGANGFMGCTIGAKLGLISSDLIYPVNPWYRFDDGVRELKLTAGVGQAWVIHGMNFNDEKMVERVCSNSNVVINLIGPRKNLKRPKDFDHVNIEIPRRIAKAARENPEIIRMIHMSAVGAAPDSPSLDLKTKYWGEQAVLEEFPNATILRPTTVVGMNDYFLETFRDTVTYFHDKIIVTNDCTQLRQPIFVADVAQVVVNSLKLDESCGNIYEIGGPHVYSRLELYEIMMNTLKKPVQLKKVDQRMMMKIAERFINWKFFNLDSMIKDNLDLVVDPKAKNISDLYVKPLSFPWVSQEILGRHAAMEKEELPLMAA